MLIESVHMHIKTLVYFFVERSYPTVPSVGMADALASNISNYKFQLQLNLKLKSCKFQ